MPTKTDQIRAAWLAGGQIGALRIAARFFDLSEGTIAFKRGIGAFNHPDFYRQIGKEPQELIFAWQHWGEGGPFLLRPGL
jgi:hypothetical protein